MIQFRKIYYRTYEISRHGIIRRVAPAPSTYPGRILKPYRPGSGTQEYVKLSRAGTAHQYPLRTLIERAWGKGKESKHD